MTIKRVKAAAARRDIYFNGRKEWINSCVGYGYAAYSPYGGILQATTLDGFYRLVMAYPVTE